MKYRVRHYSAALLLSAVPFVASCSKNEEAGAGGSGSNKTAAVSSIPSVPVTASEWGFTARLPKSTEMFVSAYRLGEAVTSFKNSGFVKKLLSIPEVAQEINLDQLQTMLDNNADAKVLLSLLEKEAVWSASEGFTENTLKIVRSLGPIIQASIKSSIEARSAAPAADAPPVPAFAKLMQSDPAAVSAAIQGLLDSDIPPVLVALNAGGSKTKIDEMIKGALGMMPPEAKDKVESGTFKVEDKHEFQSLTFKVSKAIPPEAVEQVKAQLGQLVGDPAKAASLTGKLLAKTVELSWGWVDDNLVIGLGRDHSHVTLAAPAEGVFSVPAVASRAGAWQAKKPITLSYSSQKTNEAISAALGGLMETVVSIMQSGSGRAPFPMDPIIADLKKLSARASELFPSKVSASVAATWWDGGLHLESFGGPVSDAYDSSKPLIYGSLAGPSTVLLSESRVNEASRDKAFAFLEEAASTLWASFEKNIKPNLPPDAQQNLAMTGMVIPMVKEYWKSIQVFRSALGSESAFIVNLDGTMPALPQIPPDFKDMKIPRILAVSDLKDASKLSEAWTGFSAPLGMLAAQAGMKPEPLEKKEGNVTMWGFQLPMDTGDVWPHTAVSGERWYFGTSPSFTKESAAKTPAGSGPPSGAHVRVNFKAVWTYVNSLKGIFPIPDEEKPMVETVLQLAGALEEVDARTSQDKGDTHVKVFIGIKDVK